MKPIAASALRVSNSTADNARAQRKREGERGGERERERERGRAKACRRTELDLRRPVRRVVLRQSARKIKADLPTKITPAKIVGLTLSGKFPMDMRMPPL